MKKGILSLLALIVFVACDGKKEGTHVLIETSVGDITVRLFDDTPKHRDNFIRLAREGVYDSIMWHRIVPDLMIQTGDPTLRPGHAPCTIDTSTLKYTVPQEILFPRYIHKRGMLAAARQPDEKNPKKASSASQWYIVTGEVYTTATLADFYQTIYQDAVNALWRKLQDQHSQRLATLEKSNEKAYDALQDSILTAAESAIANCPPTPFNEVQKRAYTTTGGCPHLDGEYTVFGEVTNGMDVVDKIAHTPTDEYERPLREVFIRKVTVLP